MQGLASKVLRGHNNLENFSGFASIFGNFPKSCSLVRVCTYKLRSQFLHVLPTAKGISRKEDETIPITESLILISLRDTAAEMLYVNVVKKQVFKKFEIPFPLASASINRGHFHFFVATIALGAICSYFFLFLRP